MIEMFVSKASLNTSLPDSAALPSAGYTRQRTVCTRQSLPRHSGLCRVSDFGHSAKTLPRALALGIVATWRDPGRHLCRVPNGRHSAKRPPRVPPRGRFAECWVLALGKVGVLVTCEGHFAECFCISTRQSWHIFFFFLCFSI